MRQNLGCVIRKPALRICKNKGAYQLHCNRAAYQRLCSRNIDSTIPLHFKPLSIICGCAAQFVPGSPENLDNRFSHDLAH